MPSKPREHPAAKRKVEFLKLFLELLDIPGWNFTLLALYGSMFLRAGNGEKDGLCWVRHGDLARELRLKNRTHVLERMQRLRELGAIELFKRGRHGNRYRVHDWKDILERHRMSAKTDISDTSDVSEDQHLVSVKTNISDVGFGEHPFIDIKEPYKKNMQRTAADAASGAVAAATAPIKITELLDALWESHPPPDRGPRSYARDQLKQFLASGGDPAMIRERHAAYCQWWAAQRETNPSAFVPWLGRWFKDRDWMTPPPERKQPEAEKTGFQQMAEKLRQKHLRGEL